jgi:hypothetical protein
MSSPSISEIVKKSGANIMENIEPLQKKESLKTVTYQVISPMTIPPLPTNQTDQNLASEFYARLTKWINDFNESLGDDYDTGVQLVNFGQTVQFRIEDVGYWDPSLISFIGHKEDGSPVKLIQHVTQISILLQKMKRQSPEEPKRPIRFIW